MVKIIPNIWFDTQAQEAAELYTSLFDNSRITQSTSITDTPSGTVDILTLDLAGQEFMMINGGPHFKINPSISMMVGCTSKDEVDTLWQKLIAGGEALMELGEYPFSEKYGWVVDRFGLSWQIMYVVDGNVTQKITPNLLFVGEQVGRAEEAVQFYTSVFKNSAIEVISKYGEGAEPNQAEYVNFASFKLEGYSLSAMDSALEHNFQFNEAISLVVRCDTQEEIDYYWNKLSAVPEAEQCGWLKDTFGVSWQVEPTVLGEMMSDPDPEKVAQVTQAFLKMKKLDIEELKKMYRGE